MLSPAYKITFASPPGGGLLGTASAVVPGSGGSARVIDTTEDAQASTIIDLQVMMDMDVAANQYSLKMGQVGGFRPAHGGEITIELGYAEEDELVQVMKGASETVRPALGIRQVTGYCAATTLMRTRMDETFESKSAGDIVQTLADEAGVAVADVESGINFPAYVIDGRRNAYQHMQALADLCGFDVYLNHENELVFKKFNNGETIHIFDYAQHVLTLQVSQVKPKYQQTKVFGESPAGSESAEAWGWLTKDFSGSKGSAGSDEPAKLVENPALRTGQGAQAAADAALLAIQRDSLQGQLTVLGNPAIKLGDAVRLREVPEEPLNGTFQVRSVTHRITKKSGFITTVGFRSI